MGVNHARPTHRVSRSLLVSFGYWYVRTQSVELTADVVVTMLTKNLATAHPPPGCGPILSSPRNNDASDSSSRTDADIKQTAVWAMTQ